ncbi:MAG: LytTR family DNA-binding domain-containing protein [Bacteroidia bacterium]
MIHAIIVDDEINGLRSLQILLEEFNDEIKIVNLTNNAFEAVDMINNFRPDVVFMDISMPQLNGFEVLERLEFKNFYLVFTTAHKKFALTAIKYGATDYILKPIDKKELANAIEKIKFKIKEQYKRPDVFEMLKLINEKHNFKVHLPTKKGVEYVIPSNIIYIEADSNYSIVSLTNGQNVQVTNALKDFELQLCKKEFNFIRVHHSYIINVDYVTRYIKDDGGLAVLKGVKTIPISRQKKDEFLNLINFPT